MTTNQNLRVRYRAIVIHRDEDGEEIGRRAHRLFEDEGDAHIWAIENLESREDTFEVYIVTEEWDNEEGLWLPISQDKVN